PGAKELSLAVDSDKVVYLSYVASDVIVSKDKAGTEIRNAHIKKNSKRVVPNFTMRNMMVARPSFDASDGDYEQGKIIKLSTTTPGAEVHCTIDGTVPTESSPIC